ncbi:hypothetical protein GF325_15740 [Candidatus Bathyarchaeota archaeon]|nr:hypothetical protein [Candidatus Bathyarchaeota archaeon]
MMEVNDRVLEILQEIRKNPTKIALLEDGVFNLIQDHARDICRHWFHDTMHFHAPAFDGTSYSTETIPRVQNQGFKSVSITGTACSLQCDHCRGSMLDPMIQSSPGKFERDALECLDNGAIGLLVSGGSDKRGTVPIMSIIDALKRIKQQHDIKILIHSGFLENKDLARLKAAGIDGIMFDVCGSKETLERICHLNRHPTEYVHMVNDCISIGLPVMPHVILGLHEGKIKGEYRALQMLSRNPPDVLVLVILMPQKDTPLENIAPTPLETVTRLFTLARIFFPRIPVMLGCAKPPGEYKLQVEKAALLSGLNGIAFPLQETIDLAIEMGKKLQIHNTCCALVERSR